MTTLLLKKDADLTRYVEEVAKIPLLEREEELELARRYQKTHDVRAAHRLVVANLRFVVVSAASAYTRSRASCSTRSAEPCLRQPRDPRRTA